MSCRLILNTDNPNVLEWQNVTNSITGLPVTTADVVVTLLDPRGNPVTGMSWPANMTHVADGTYRATLDAALALVENREYVAHIVAEVASVVVADLSVSATALRRTA